MPRVIDKLAARANKLFGRSAGEQNPNKVRHMTRRASKLLKRALHVIDVATDRGRISQECAAAVTAMLGEVQTAFGRREEGQFRSAQVTARVRPEQALDLITKLVEETGELESSSVDPLVITCFIHPPSAGGAGSS